MYGYNKTRKSPVDVIERISGRGLQLSPMFVAGRTISNTGVDRISQSLYCLFSTRRGERLFQPEYGTRIYDQLFEPNDFILRDMVKYYAEEDIKRWEPRITATVEVELVGGTNEVSVSIIYSIIGDATQYRLIYNFSRSVEDSGGDTFE